jgi:hypothetical protein
VPPVPVEPVVGGGIILVFIPSIMRVPSARRDIVIVIPVGRVAVMRMTPLRPSWRVTVACPEAPPGSRGAAALTMKLQIEKVWIGPGSNPAILLFVTVKVQEPKSTLPLAVPPPLEGVTVNVDGVLNVNVAGVAGRPGLKSEPFGMVNCSPTTACTVLEFTGTDWLETVRSCASSPSSPPQATRVNELTSAKIATR